jgi:chromosome segregation ATPase
MLVQELIELSEDFEKSEARKNELENQIEIMRNDLIKAQHSLSRLEQYESEKLRLKEDLELKIEEFNLLTRHYQHEKESYLSVLEHIQDQVNIYKQKSEQFDTEKGSWSKQIDELKAELAQTKATLVKMEELEKINAQLKEELQAKDVEIYKLKKENERALNKQIEQFKMEMKLYQDKIAQYEKDREIWEKQMKQMKAQFAGLEASLEEKENFIKQFIKQPPSHLSSIIKTTDEKTSEAPAQQMIQPSPKLRDASTQNKSVSQPQQTSDWIFRMMTQRQGTYQQPAPRMANNTMDFFTLRNKTTQVSAPGPIYANQWHQG